MSRTTQLKHIRHGEYERVRRAKHLQGFLDENATDLNGTGTVTGFTVSGGVITSATHGLVVGDGPFLADANSDAVLPTPLQDTAFYWVASVPDSNTLTLASSRNSAAILLTDDGSAGTGSGLSIIKADSAEAIYEYLKVNSPNTVRDATDADSL